MRAEPEVRQPQRDARQGRGEDVVAKDGGRIDTRELTFFLVNNLPAVQR
jgi:hypothetical protein